MKVLIKKGFFRRTNWIIGLFIIAVYLLGCPKPPIPLKNKGAGVHGSVFVSIRNTDHDKQHLSGKRVYLPDLKLFLRNIKTGEESQPQITDLFGRFMFPIQKPGTYRLIWKGQAGWAAGQYPDTLVIKNNTQFPGPIEISADKTGRILSGQVKLADGGSPWFYEEFFGITRTATLIAIDSTGNAIAQPVRANVVGEFAIAGVTTNALRIQAKNEADVTDLPIGSGGTLPSLNIVFKNHRPQMRGFIAKRHCAAGETITILARAHDFDGDKLSFDWKNNLGNGTLVPFADSAKWTLPKESGQYVVYVVASDGRGGYATDKLTVKVGATDEYFNGKVVDPNNVPVLGAVVSINGAKVSTDSSGSFRLKATLSTHYVMNITKSGFALFSRRLNQGQTGQTWQLVRTQITSVDPKNPIDLIDRRPELDEKQMRGAQIKLQPNSLVDSAGKLPAGFLNASIATLDIANGEAPGDWGAIQDGREVNLISYGVAFVDFSDGTSKKFNIAPGKTADVIMSVPASMIATAASSIPLWSYDEIDGLWKPSGKATLNRNTGIYSGKVTHFSTINTDLAKTDAACLKVILNSTVPHGLKLRIRDVAGGIDFVQTFEFIMNDDVNAVYRLPANTDVQLELLDLNNNVIGNLTVEETPGVAIPNNIINTGPPIPAGHTLWPDPNTAEIDVCKAITLNISIPNWSGGPIGSPFLTFKGVGTLAQANEYYSGVDPNNLRTTLGDWWTTNGFDATGNAPGVIRTSFLNDNDLGYGRDMYFLQHADGSVSAYVTKYGPPDQNPGSADLAASKTNPGETVCMEYTPVEGATVTTPIVKFFAFEGNGNGALAPRVTSIDFDGFGPKFLPNVCTNCHGGSYYAAATPGAPTFDEINISSSFREFDLATFKYPGARIVPNAVEKDLFKQQNLLVKDTEPRQAIKDLIDGWYLGGGTDQNVNYAPTGWLGAPQQQLYRDVVSVSCRTCHIALVSDHTTFGINWNSYSQFQTRRLNIRDYVCNSNKSMPHSLITYKNFWLSTSPSKPATLRDYSALDWVAFGNCQ